MKITSIKDQPIKDSNSDLLDAEKYATALSKFVMESDTPLTIGMQGEWGTGKTSLMYMLKEKIENMSEEENYAIATSWINTWEYSMFKGVEQTTPAVLKGMLDKLKESCGDKWTLTDDIDSKIKKVGSFLGNVANQLVKSNTGINVKGAIDNHNVQAVLDIAEIKSDIKDLIENLILDEKNSYHKVVFFIDDLDRIEPSDAVEILEALKNIFDIHNCIFILAIDYDVVVKGLEKKFGKKTDLNEREFRSFFDKIIQVPFSMPTGAYNIQNFLDTKLKDLGIHINEELLPKYVHVVSNTVGFNPRSLKRYLNTFSLLRKISEMSEDDELTNTYSKDDDDFVLFNLIGIQVSYPKIFRLFNQFPEYLSWDEEVAAKLDLDLVKLKENSKKHGESADEKWEQILFGISQPDPYLRLKWLDVAKVLDNLRKHFKNEKELNTKIHSAMEFASITSVDDAPEGKTTKHFKVEYFDNYDVWEEQLLDKYKQYSNETMTLLKSIYLFIESKYPDVKIKFSKIDISFWCDKDKIANLKIAGVGVTLNLLRKEENDYKLPSIPHDVRNLKNSISDCKWYKVVDISSFDEPLKECFNDSYIIGKEKRNVLKKDNPNIQSILGITI